MPVEHDIEVLGEFQRPYVYQVPRTFYEEAHAKIRELEEKGVMEKGKSNFVSPLVCARKKDGRLRLCGDFRALNKITVPDLYPLPRIDVIKQSVRGYLFSTIDLKEGFYQVPIAAKDKHKTAMVTPWGLYV